jgi:WD40 repeat protein
MLVRITTILALAGLALAPAAAAAGEAATAQPASMELVGHKGAVNAIALAPDGKTVATAGADGTVRIWDAAGGTETLKVEQRGKAVAVAFSPDGRTVAAAFADEAGAVIAFDRHTGKHAWRISRRLPGPRAGVAFAPDGRRCVAAFGDECACLDAASGRMFFLFRGRPGGATSVAISPDGKSLAFAGTGSVALMDPTVGRMLQNWRAGGSARSLVFLPDGRKLALADGGKAVRMMDLSTGRQETAFEGKQDIVALAASPDGKRVATAASDGTILLWSSSGGQERRFAAGETVTAMVFSADSKRLATAGPDGAALWDLTRDERPLRKGFTLTEKALPGLWDDLASEEGGRVYAAVRLLRADPARSVPFLQKRLAREEGGPDRKKVKQWIADLDSDDFTKREEATKALEKLGPAAEDALRQALEGKPSLEAKVRLERLLKRLGSAGALTAGQQRDVRAVRVLEQAGTPAARKLLHALVKESPGWWASREAKEALGRLERREKKP